MRYLFILLICSAIHNTYAQKADTFHVFFPVAASTLSANGKQTLDSLLYNDIITKGRKVGLIGYADNTGTDSINNPLSLERAKTVANYLQYMGIDTTDIELVTGKGAIKRNSQQSYPADRRVDIIPGGFKKKAVVTPSDITAIQQLATIGKGQKVSLNNIIFLAGTPVILEKSYPVLQALTKTLKENPNIKIRIEGHVCCFHGDVKPPKYPYSKYTQRILNDQERIEQTLSDDRAYEVKKYLMKHGIDPDRLSCKGFGTTVPLYEPDGKTMNADLNRRVEIRIMDK